MNWNDYENEVYESLKLYYPNSIIERNVKKQGRYSQKGRQIDIYIEEIVGGVKTVIVVECKYYNKKIDVKTVESFISMADDLNADVGLMITEKGFTSTAIKRAHNNPKYIELDILNLAELQSYQGEWAVPYSGENAVVLLAPFGWIIDASKRPDSVCYLYRRGLSMIESAENLEIAYANFWNRHKNNESLDDLLALQEKDMVENRNVLKLEYINNLEREDARTMIRIADVEGYPAIEMTGFIEFADFIFFCVWFSEEIALPKNIRKLERLLKIIIPIKINDPILKEFGMEIKPK